MCALTRPKPSRQGTGVCEKYVESTYGGNPGGNGLASAPPGAVLDDDDDIIVKVADPVTGPDRKVVRWTVVGPPFGRALGSVPNGSTSSPGR